MAEEHPGDPSATLDERVKAMPEPYPFECQFCETTFRSLVDYTTHLAVHQTRFEYPHSCPQCERGFVCRDELQLHSRLHADLQPYKCKLCDEPFKFARCLEYHLQSHGGIRVYRCRLCNSNHSEFLELSDLHEHLKDHQMGRVPEEEAAVFPELKLAITPTPEVEQVQLQEEEEEEVEAGAENVTRVRVGGGTDGASVQQRTMATAAGAEQHFKSEAALRMEEEEENDILDEEAMFARAVNVKKTFCNLCSKKMATRKSLNTHYKSVHMKNAHTCGVCRTSFLFSRLLEAHTRKRKQIISCEFCDLRFCSNKRWSSHIERHQEGTVAGGGGGGAGGGIGTTLGGGAMVMFPRAVPITSSSRPMVTITSAQQQQQSTTAINNRQSLLKTNHTNNNNQRSHSLLFPTTKSSNPASLLLASVTHQPTVNLVNLTEGGNTIGKFPCDACGKIFLSLNYLQAHLVKRRNPNFQFQCDTCEHRFSKKAILEEHQLYHERNPKKVPKLVINKGRVQNGFNNGNNNNNNIFRSSPSNTSAGGENKVQTPVAGKSSETPSADEEMDYDRHIIRLSDTSFKCNCCHRTFKAVNHLKCHLRYTHMKKNFKCRSCSQQFPFYKLYLAHMKNSKLCERCDKRICAKVRDSEFCFTDHCD